MKAARVCGLAAALATALWTGGGWAQGGIVTYPNVSVEVTDAISGAPIAGAQVAFGWYSDIWMVGLEPVYTSTFTEDIYGFTDSEGRFLVAVMPDTYTIITSAEGYAPSYIDDFTISEPTSISVRLLPLAAASLMHVDCVKYALSGGKSDTRDLEVRVVIRDDFGKVVAGASVDLFVTRNGSLVRYGTLTTNKRGIAKLKLPRAANGSYVTTVSDVRKSDFVYAGSATTPVNEYRKGIDRSRMQFCQ